MRKKSKHTTCPNCGRDLNRYPALYPNQKCPTLREVIKDMFGFRTKWRRYRRLSHQISGWTLLR